jgi:hypothetical protein
MTTTSQKHGSTAETEPDSTIYTQGTKMGYVLLDPELDSKVLKDRYDSS